MNWIRANLELSVLVGLLVALVALLTIGVATGVLKSEPCPPGEHRLVLFYQKVGHVMTPVYGSCRP